MAGHSKFANIKHRKEKEDSKRSKVFAKLGREITIAVKLQGKDIAFNPRLRLAVDKAKFENMPKDNIEKAIKKGANENETSNLDEVRYEGYAKGGIAVVVEALTDNRNRTAGEVRHAFSRFSGTLGESNSVYWLFDKKGLIFFDESINEDELLELALSAGAEDVDGFTVITNPNDFYEILEKLKDQKIIGKEIRIIPKNVIQLEGEELANLEKMVEYLENLDDVQEVYTNLDGILST